MVSTHRSTSSFIDCVVVDAEIGLISAFDSTIRCWVRTACLDLHKPGEKIAACLRSVVRSLRCHALSTDVVVQAPVVNRHSSLLSLLRLLDPVELMLVLIIVGVACSIVHHHASVSIIVHISVLLLILGLIERLLLRLLLLLLLLVHLILRLVLIELSLLWILVLHGSHDYIVASLAPIVAIIDSKKTHICSIGL